MRKEVIILGAIIALVIIGAVIGSKYYRTSVQQDPVTANTNSGKPKIAPEQLIRPDSASLGPADAKVTLVEFYDPECESCASFAPVVRKIVKDYEGKIRLVARYMPFHQNSMTAATFIEAAGEQGKYWEAQELLFLKQPEWGTNHGPATGAPPTPINELFDKYAKELGLDTTKAGAEIKSKKFTAKIEQDQKDGQAIGVRRTPTIFVNGRELATLAESSLRSLIDEEMKK